MDTVSVRGMAIQPWSPQIRDGRLYGRGACDTKGGLAAMMHALASLAEERVRTPCEIVFAATVDEEYSYRGVAALCRESPFEPLSGNTESGLHADAAIVAEPTSLNMVTASKGLVRWKIETRGRAAHSAKPHLGVSAIEKMAKIITAMQSDTERLSLRQHPLLGPATCNIGRIRGGEQINFVPDRCEIEIDRRMLPGESVESVLQHSQALLDRLAAEDRDFDAQISPPMLTDVPLETDKNCQPVRTMASVLSELGLDATPIGVPFCSDASKFGAIGIPSMILGPGSIDQAHAAVEFVDCQQVIAAAEIYRRFMIEFDPSP
jgi:acetylornithine deacetylase